MTRRAYAAVAGVAALMAAGLIGASLVGAKADPKPAAPVQSSTPAPSILAGIPAGSMLQFRRLANQRPPFMRPEDFAHRQEGLRLAGLSI